MTPVARKIKSHLGNLVAATATSSGMGLVTSAGALVINEVPVPTSKMIVDT